VNQSVLGFFACLSDIRKTKQHAQPKNRTKPGGSAKSKLKVSSDGLSTAPSKSKKSSTAAAKSSIVAARSRSTSVMPVSRTPGAENRPPGEAELDEAEEGMEDKLYCICKTKYDDEKVMIACDRCVTANVWVAIRSYRMVYAVATNGITHRVSTCQTYKLISLTNLSAHFVWRVRAPDSFLTFHH
jgi:hypothetical protein